MKRFITRFMLPVLITAAAVGGAVLLVRSAESADREPPESPPPLVEAVEVHAAAARPKLMGTGVVEPAREASISPEVSGRIVELSDKLVLGGRFVQGEVMVRLDDRQYKLAVKQRRGEVRRAELDLELEKAHGKVARQEWALMGEGKDAGRLAGREPQREVAQVGVEIARGAVSQAKLDLERTVIRAPFNATVDAESVEIGEVVSPGSVIATLVGTDAFWVRVSLPVEDLALLEVPGYGGTAGSPARVIQRLGPQRTVERTGTVVRLISELDRESRTAQVLVEVISPLDPPPGALPLLPGAFVDVELTGAAPTEVIAVPRLAVFEGRRTWVLDPQQRLVRRELNIEWGDDQAVYVSGGLSDGERVVIMPPSSALEGMEVRTKDSEAPPEPAAISAIAREQAEG